MASATIESLQKEIVQLQSRCESLENREPIHVLVQSLSPESLTLTKPFYIVVRCSDDQYIATFFDANLSASGDTPSEAVSNLKDFISSSFELLSGMNEHELGPEPRKQKKVLQEFIQEKS
ncbi:MAG: hypothetical protein NTX50_23480 [Candidatus Sumerlaeota bacterium]|nr:hypothetical protein [Candidatus Sumerlaeota bacterium]